MTIREITTRLQNAGIPEAEWEALREQLKDTYGYVVRN